MLNSMQIARRLGEGNKNELLYNVEYIHWTILAFKFFV